MCQMPNIWHLKHQTPKTNHHQLFQISKNLTHIYSTISNMRQYGHQCQTLFSLFNSFFLSPPIICLSPSTTHLSLSLSLWHSHRRLATPSHHVERKRPPRLATDHWPTLQRRGTPVWRTRWPKVKTSISDSDGGSCPNLIVALER